MLIQEFIGFRRDKKRREFESEEAKKERLFSARKEVYAECISMLYMQNANKEYVSAHEKEETEILITKAEMLAGPDLEKILKKIYNDYAWNSDSTVIPDVSLEISKAKLEMKIELGQEINRDALNDCNMMLEEKESGFASRA